MLASVKLRSKASGGSAGLSRGKGGAGKAPTTASDDGGGWVTKAIIVQIQVRQTGRREVTSQLSVKPLTPTHARGEGGGESRSLLEQLGEQRA